MTGSHHTRKVIQNMVQKLITEYSPQKLILYGSHAYGSPGPDSDIDLLIIKETSERFIDRWVTVQRIITGLQEIKARITNASRNNASRNQSPNNYW